MPDNGNTVTLNVIVHKAEIQLMDGETLNGFSQAICGAAAEYVKKNMSLGKEDWTYVADVKADVLVASVYKREGKSSYWALKYARDEAGAFSFSDMTEVRPVMNYVPVKPSLAVKKSAEPETVVIEKSIFSGIL